jgi:integrase/recombinase XerD
MMLQTGNIFNLNALTQAYRLRAKIEGKSPNTIRIYLTALTSLESFLQENGLPIDVTQVGAQEIRQFIFYLQQAKAFRKHPFTRQQPKGLTGHTINCYLRAIRAFWSWLISEDVIDTNPFDRLKVPKPPKKVILPFSESQMRSLIDMIDTHSPIGFRDWTLILTLLDTGLRVTELVELKMEDTSITQRCLKVWGKGGKERVVPIGGTVQRAIAKYISRYRPEPMNQLSPHLFLTRSGGPLTANRVETIIEQYARRAVIQGVRCSPHTLRHTFAIYYLRNGGDVFTLQRILGHETLDMVRNYVNVAQYDLQAAHQKCSPVDNMQLKARGSTAQSIREQQYSVAN